LDRNQQIKYWYLEYSHGIYNFITYYTGRKDVEDLVQEVFIRAIKSFDSYKGNSKPKTWLYSIARHVAIDDRRKRRFLKWIPEEILQSIRSKEKTPDEILNANEDIKDLYQSINKLKNNYREVLILRGIKDFSVSETAEILNWSESKVRVTLHRAISALKKLSA
jgi:RNA polymerase sigma-70 factor (ECF subfamily)